MPLAVLNGKSLFFAHVPKAGGSSVEEYLMRRFGKLSLIDQNKRTGVKGTGLIVPATHLAAEDLKELLPHDLDFCFAVVRDPVRRLQSEYRYQTRVSRSSRFSFSTWLRIMFACLRQEPRIYENHIRPQSDLVPDNAEIFHLEDGAMQKFVARIDEVLGETAPEIEPRHINKREVRPITLYREDIELIEAHYKADYERFGFETHVRDGLPKDRLKGVREAFARLVARVSTFRQRRGWIS